ncbi:hypothetical protein BGW42_005500, partial [Actinomortierella wolfii]
DGVLFPQLMKQLISIQTERNKDTAFALIDKFRQDWVGQASLLEFLNKNYFRVTEDTTTSVDEDVSPTPTQTITAVDNGRGRGRGGGRGRGRGRGRGKVDGVSSGGTRSTVVATTVTHFDPSLAVAFSHPTGPNEPLSDVLVEADDDFDRYYDIAGSSGQGRRPAPRESWMVCFRQGYPTGSIDTNNLIESWHNTLKRHFFRDRLKRRADHVIYILVYGAIPKFKEACDPELANVGRASKTEIIARGQRTYCKHMGLVHLYDGGVESGLLTSFTYGSYNYGIPFPPTAASITPTTPASLKAQISEIKNDLEVPPANVDAEAAALVEDMRELIAMIVKDPKKYIRSREDIDMDSIRDKLQLYRRKRQRQQVSYKPRKRYRNIGENEKWPENLKEEKIEKKEGEEAEEVEEEEEEEEEKKYESSIEDEESN